MYVRNTPFLVAYVILKLEALKGPTLHDRVPGYLAALLDASFSVQVCVWITPAFAVCQRSVIYVKKHAFFVCHLLKLEAPRDQHCMTGYQATQVS
jgi:hypothetical protein